VILDLDLSETGPVTLPPLRTGVFYLPRPTTWTPLAELCASFFDGHERSKSRSISPSSSRGYRRIGTENLAVRAGIAACAPQDRNESFAAELADASGKGRGRFAWPNVKGFREAWRANHVACAALGDRVLRRIVDASAVAIPSADAHLMRAIRYPAGRGTSTTLGAGPHADFGWFTFVADDHDGLEVFSAGGWTPVSVPGDRLLVLLGDCAALATAGALPATEHRVPQPRVPRTSLVFFYDPDRSTVVAPPSVSFAMWLESKELRTRMRAAWSTQ
jgi:isopenicillin N synthase-like dioxygenase